MKPARTFFSNIEHLENRRKKRLQTDAETLEKLLKRIGTPPDLAAAAAMKLRPQIADDWIFVMISPQQNANVIRWLQKNSRRPMKAVQLWAELLTCLRIDTGEILRSRDDLAKRTEQTPQHVSSIITELTSINAIRRVKEGRKVRYYLNPYIATHVSARENRREARERAGPLLFLMEGGAQV